LIGSELSHLATLTDDPGPAIQPIVVERNGEIVACWAMLQVIHVDGLWQRGDVQGQPSVGRTLLAAMTRELLTVGASEVFTLAVDPTVEDMLLKVGGKQVPGRPWVFPVLGRGSERGRQG